MNNDFNIMDQSAAMEDGMVMTQWFSKVAKSCNFKVGGEEYQ